MGYNRSTQGSSRTRTVSRKTAKTTTAGTNTTASGSFMTPKEEELMNELNRAQGLLNEVVVQRDSALTRSAEMSGTVSKLQGMLERALPQEKASS